MKRTFSILACMLCSGLMVQAQSNLNNILEDFYHHPERVLVTAHRAAHAKYPENSIGAIREAIRIGVDVVELDVHETKDGVLIIMHDATVTRTTGKPGKIRDYTYAELQQFPLLFNGQPSAEKIPTFEEALNEVKGKVMLDIDFKEGSAEAAQKTVDLVEKTGTAPQVLFFLYAAKYAPMLHDMDKNIPIMPRSHNAEETVKIMESGKYAAIHIDDSFYSDTLMARVREHGERVWINALGKYDDMEEKQKDSGFDAMMATFKYANCIQTNLPEELLAYLKKKGLHR